MDNSKCVCCGEYVPEGSMVCKYCVEKIRHDNSKIERKKAKEDFMRKFWNKVKNFISNVFKRKA